MNGHWYGIQLPDGYVDLKAVFQVMGKREYGDHWTRTEIDMFNSPSHKSDWGNDIPITPPDELTKTINDLTKKFSDPDYIAEEQWHHERKKPGVIWLGDIRKRITRSLRQLDPMCEYGIWEPDGSAQLYVEELPPSEVRAVHKREDRIRQGQELYSKEPDAAFEAALNAYTVRYETGLRCLNIRNKLRQALFANEITAYHYDSKTGKLISVEPSKWLAEMFEIDFSNGESGDKDGVKYITLFKNDWKVQFNGEPAKHSVELGNVDVCEIKKETRGRKPGSGEIDDSKPISKARELVKGGMGKWEACGNHEVIASATGNSDDAKRKRIYGKI